MRGLVALVVVGPEQGRLGVTRLASWAKLDCMKASSADPKPMSDSDRRHAIDAAAAWRVLLALKDWNATATDVVGLTRRGDGWSFDPDVARATIVLDRQALMTGKRSCWTSAVEVLPEAAWLFDLYLPFLGGAGDGRRPCVFAHLGQSLDGRIATGDGCSKWVTGDEDLTHTHRMRALADAVLVGAATVRHDDPRLTVRRVDGPNPLRVVVDSSRRLTGDRCLFTDGAAPSLVFCTEDGGRSRVAVGQAEVEVVPSGADGRVDVVAVLDCLARRGIRRLFVEGGGITVSRFLRAGLVDRLQLVVAPMIIGSGRPSIALPEIRSLDQALRRGPG